MKKITFLFLICCSGFIYGQTMVNDFESGDGLTNTGGGISATVVANPDTSGSNTTANCLRLGRNGTQWWIFAGIDVSDLAVSSSETKFLSMWVYGPTTDIACRFNATADDNNGTNGGIIRPDVLHSGAAGWEQIVWPIVDAQASSNFTLGTLYKIVFHPDIADAGVVPGGQMLNDTDTYLYIDQIQILDSNPLLSNDQFNLEESISIFQNPSKSNFRIVARNNVNITDVALYDMLGSRVKNISKIDNEYDMSNLSSGLYIVKILDDTGATISKKLVKQ